MAIGNRPWCDFVIYTPKEMNVECVQCDADFWNNNLLPKLEEFYNGCVVPQVVNSIYVSDVIMQPQQKN